MKKASSNKPNVIDGFSSVQAVRRSRKRSTGARTRPSRSKLPAVEEGQKKKKEGGLGPGARIGSTIVPAKYDIVCYECDYTFTIQGRIHDTICPKCRASLTSTHYTIDTEWTETIRTIGSVEIKPEGILKGVELIARDVILAGNAEEGFIRVCGSLVLCPGARFDITKITMKDLFIRKGCKFTIRRKITCRNLDVEGNFSARIHTDGVVTVKAGGFLRGEVHGPHLIVEDGGGLKAKVVVGR